MPWWHKYVVPSLVGMANRLAPFHSSGWTPRLTDPDGGGGVIC